MAFEHTKRFCEKQSHQKWWFILGHSMTFDGLICIYNYIYRHIWSCTPNMITIMYIYITHLYPDKKYHHALLKSLPRASRYKACNVPWGCQVKTWGSDQKDRERTSDELNSPMKLNMDPPKPVSFYEGTSLSKQKWRFQFRFHVFFNVWRHHEWGLHCSSIRGWLSQMMPGRLITPFLRVI
jgi:hypothetical protein